MIFYFIRISRISGYTIVSTFWFLLFLFNIFFCFFLAFSFYFLFPMNEIFMEKCSRCLPQKKTSRYTIVWFVWGVHYYFPRILVWVWSFFSFLSFFLLLFIFHEWNFHEIMKCSRCLPQKKTTSRYTIVWFVWGYTIVSSCFPEVIFFFNHFLYLFHCFIFLLIT